MSATTETPTTASASASKRAFDEFWHYFTESRGAVAGMIFMIFIILIALFAPFIAPHSPIETNSDFFRTPPAWQEGGTSQFLLGTDAVGRDILSRLIYGSRYSLLVGCIVICLSLTFGIFQSWAQNGDQNQSHQ